MNLDFLNVSDFEEDNEVDQINEGVQVNKVQVNEVQVNEFQVNEVQVNEVDSTVDSSRSRKRKVVVESARNLLK